MSRKDRITNEEVRRKKGMFDAASRTQQLKCRWGRTRRQNAPSTLDEANDNVGPGIRTTNGRETKDEVGRRLQKYSRNAVVNTS